MILTCSVCPTLQVVGEQEYVDLLQIRYIIPGRSAFTFDIFTYFLSQLRLVRWISCSEHCCCSLSHPTLCNPIDCSTPGFPFLHHLPELAQTHVLWVGDAINRLVFCGLLLLPSISSSVRVFSNESALCIRLPKYWSFSFSISPSNEYSGLISFRMDWLDLLAVQGTPKNLLLHHSSEASILCCLAFFMVQLSYTYMTTGKNIALTIWTFVGQVMSLLFNMPSRFVIAFLLKSRCLLISWPQSPSPMILEPKNIKSVTVPIVSSSVCHEVKKLDAMIFVF